MFNIFRHKKNKKGDQAEMSVEELKKAYDELSAEDKELFAQSLQDGGAESSEVETTEEVEAVDTAELVPEPAPQPEMPTEVTKEMDDDVKREEIDALKSEVAELKATIEGLKKEPVKAEKETVSELDKLSQKFEN